MYWRTNNGIVSGNTGADGISTGLPDTGCCKIGRDKGRTGVEVKVLSGGLK